MSPVVPSAGTYSTALDRGGRRCSFNEGCSKYFVDDGSNRGGTCLAAKAY